MYGVLEDVTLMRLQIWRLVDQVLSLVNEAILFFA